MSMLNQTLDRRSLLQGAAALTTLTALSIGTHRSAYASKLATPVSPLMDDFSNGGYSITDTEGVHNQVIDEIDVLGGARYTMLNIARNHREQPVHLDTGTGHLNMSAGVEAYYRLELGYGYKMGEDGPYSVPMHADLSTYSRFRVQFAALTALVNFNIILFTNGGNASYGENFGQLLGSLTKDVLFTDLVTQYGKVNMADVSHLLFIFQSEGSFALDSIELA